MRVFAVSDVHVDYPANAAWVESLSSSDHQGDVLILAGDISDSLPLLDRCLTTLVRRFKKVLFVPGNHELWVVRDAGAITSLQKLKAVCAVAEQCGASMQPYHSGSLSIVPLMSWYDYTFGQPCDDLLQMWADFRACRWPDALTAEDVATHFLGMNGYERRSPAETVISFSHFLPRIDVMPAGVPAVVRKLYPVLGTTRLEQQIRRLGSAIHVYGHSHLNRRVRLDGTLYVNNAFAYPHEAHIASKALACVYDTEQPAPSIHAPPVTFA